MPALTWKLLWCRRQMRAQVPHLLLTGLPGLLHFLIPALHLLGMCLPHPLHLHLKTQLGLQWLRMGSEFHSQQPADSLLPRSPLRSQSRCTQPGSLTCILLPRQQTSLEMQLPLLGVWHWPTDRLLGWGQLCSFSTWPAGSSSLN